MRIRHVKGSEEAVTSSPFVIQKTGEFKNRWHSDVFRREAPLYLEIGMGMGTFIRTHAMLNPGIDYVGYEINTTVLYKAVQRYVQQLGADDDGALINAPGDTVNTRPEGYEVIHADPAGCNLRFIRSDARFIADDFGCGEVDRIYLNFSDPWPKDKSENRRLTAPGFLKMYREILKDDGVVEFKTDNRGLFDYSLESFPGEGWTVKAVTFDLHNDPVMGQGNVCTEYETKFSAKGNPIFKLIACKN